METLENKSITEQSRKTLQAMLEGGWALFAEVRPTEIPCVNFLLLDCSDRLQNKNSVAVFSALTLDEGIELASYRVMDAEQSAQDRWEREQDEFARNFSDEDFC